MRLSRIGEQMTHNELIDLIDGMHSKDWLTGFGGACWFGDGMMSYPCPTIEIIKKRLQ